MDWREYALEQVEIGTIDPELLATCLLKYMSQDDIQDCLDTNELTPRFADDPNFPAESSDADICLVW